MQCLQKLICSRLLHRRSVNSITLSLLYSPLLIWTGKKTRSIGILARVEGDFDTASLYHFLHSRRNRCLFASLRDLSVPLKIKCFLWLCWEQKLNTRSALGRKLKKKNLGGRIFCHQVPESANNLFVDRSMFTAASCAPSPCLKAHVSIGERERERFWQEFMACDPNANCSSGMGVVVEGEECSHLPRQKFLYLGYRGGKPSFLQQVVDTLRLQARTYHGKIWVKFNDLIGRLEGSWNVSTG